MSKHKIREDKTCLNCGSTVDEVFCPNCGQENTESRQAFYHIFTHFVFDFLHYDSSFWSTTKYLFLFPGKLSIEYMNGKRKSYLNPFTLYIFVSFLVFFINPMFTTSPPKADKIKPLAGTSISTIAPKVLGVEELIVLTVEMDDNENDDDILAKLSEIESDNMFMDLVKKVVVNIRTGGPNNNLSKEVVHFIEANFPKVLFIYMPIFAFLLWLFHGKKERFFFDSGIFTLHFFSLVLLAFTLWNGIDFLLSKLGLESLSTRFGFGIIVYVTIYFVVGVHTFYKNSKTMTILKSSVLMLINPILIIVTIALFFLAAIVKVYS